MNVGEASAVYTVVHFLEEGEHQTSATLAAKSLATLTQRAHRALGAGPILTLEQATTLLTRTEP